MPVRGGSDRRAVVSAARARNLYLLLDGLPEARAARDSTAAIARVSWNVERCRPGAAARGPRRAAGVDASSRAHTAPVATDGAAPRRRPRVLAHRRAVAYRRRLTRCNERPPQ